MVGGECHQTAIGARTPVWSWESDKVLAMRWNVGGGADSTVNAIYRESWRQASLNLASTEIWWGKFVRHFWVLDRADIIYRTLMICVCVCFRCHVIMWADKRRRKVSVRILYPTQLVSETGCLGCHNNSASITLQTSVTVVLHELLPLHHVCYH